MDIMECILKYVERIHSISRVACQSRGSLAVPGWRCNHRDRSWGGKRKVSPKRSAKECITHMGTGTAQKSQSGWPTSDYTEEWSAQHLGNARQRRITKRSKYMKRLFALLLLYSYSPVLEKPKAAMKIEKGEWVRKNNEQTDPKIRLSFPNFETPGQGSGLGFGKWEKFWIGSEIKVLS